MKNTTMILMVAVVFGVAGLAWAGTGSVFVPNHSFEDEVVPEGEFASFADRILPDDPPGGWQSVLYNHLYNPTGDGTDDWAGGILDGSTNVFAQEPSEFSVNNYMILDVNLLADHVYTVTMDVGDSLKYDIGPFDDYELAAYETPTWEDFTSVDPSLPDFVKVAWAGGAANSRPLFPLTDGEWVTNTFSWTVQNPGWDIFIAIYEEFDLPDEEGMQDYVFFDNLRITYEPVPVGPACDFSGDALCNAVDIDLMAAAVRNMTSDAQFNVDGQGDANIPDDADFDYYITDASMLATGFGDHDLNFQVNFNDFVRLSNSFGMTGTGWDQGNGNTDDMTNFNDFVRLSNNFGTSFVSDGTDVPEPAGIGVITLLALCVFRRRYG